MATIIPLTDARGAAGPDARRAALRRVRARGRARPRGRRRAPLADTRGRPLHDLRISVTDRCNFRCVYCMPRDVFDADYHFLPHAELLTFEEIARVARVFVERGVAKIRLTGGEPLLRRNVERLVEMLARTGAADLTLTTNGSLLAKKAKGAPRRRPDPRHGEPRFARRRDVPGDERRRFPGRQGARRASTPPRPRASRRSRSTWS